MDTTITVKMSVEEFDLMRRTIEGYIAALQARLIGEENTAVGRHGIRREIESTQKLLKTLQ